MMMGKDISTDAVQGMPDRAGPPRRLALLGPPGAGKGTQAAWLAEVTGAAHIATGDLVREAIAAGTPLGHALRHHYDHGELVPDQLILDLMLPNLAAAPSWILDGFPRNLRQAELLDTALRDRDMRLDRVLALRLPDAEILDRLQHRRISASTGAIYNLVSDPPPASDPGPFEQRSDDQPATIRRRLQVYHQWTEPLLAYYDKRGLLRVVDASGSVHAVHERILAALAD
jgi:adenylate kinase